MPAWPWIERSFSFDFPPSKMPDLLERLRGTPARLEDRLRGVDPAVLIRQPASGWTIQQNVGHLIDLGDLPRERLRQILAGEDTLIGADMTNAKTQVAGHNARDNADLLAEFRRERMALVAVFEEVAASDWSRSALHPRIKQPMRIVDLAYFDSEHDDYHLARIGQLLRECGA